MQLAAGLIPAFIFAGLMEGLVTPSDVIPQPVKVGLGVTAAVVYWLYLLLAGREKTWVVSAVMPPLQLAGLGTSLMRKRRKQSQSGMHSQA